MKNLINRAKFVMTGENGGPSVETIIGIAVALIMGLALILFGKAVVGWIESAQAQVSDMEVAEIGGKK